MVTLWRMSRLLYPEQFRWAKSEMDHTRTLLSKIHQPRIVLAQMRSRLSLVSAWWVKYPCPQMQLRYCSDFAHLTINLSALGGLSFLKLYKNTCLVPAAILITVFANSSGVLANAECPSLIEASLKSGKTKLMLEESWEPLNIFTVYLRHRWSFLTSNVASLLATYMPS